MAKMICNYRDISDALNGLDSVKDIMINKDSKCWSPNYLNAMEFGKKDILDTWAIETKCVGALNFTKGGISLKSSIYVVTDTVFDRLQDVGRIRHGETDIFHAETLATRPRVMRFINRRGSTSVALSGTYGFLFGPVDSIQNLYIMTYDGLTTILNWLNGASDVTAFALSIQQKP